MNSTFASLLLGSALVLPLAVSAKSGIILTEGLTFANWVGDTNKTWRYDTLQTLIRTAVLCGITHKGVRTRSVATHASTSIGTTGTPLAIGTAAYHFNII